MDIDEVKKIIELVQESGVHEIEVKEGESTIRVVASARNINEQIEIEGVVSNQDAQTAAPAKNVPSNALSIDSPMAGTFFRSPAPDEPPFVQVGDRVNIGDVLCIVESMKMMNEIKSERIGVIVGAPIENGQAIESGTTIFHIA